MQVMDGEEAKLDVSATTRQKAVPPPLQRTLDTFLVKPASIGSPGVGTQGGIADADDASAAATNSATGAAAVAVAAAASCGAGVGRDEAVAPAVKSHEGPPMASEAQGPWGWMEETCMRNSRPSSSLNGGDEGDVSGGRARVEPQQLPGDLLRRDGGMTPGGTLGAAPAGAELEAPSSGEGRDKEHRGPSQSDAEHSGKHWPAHLDSHVLSDSRFVTASRTDSEAEKNEESSAQLLDGEWGLTPVEHAATPDNVDLGVKEHDALSRPALKRKRQAPELG
eukprot:jgi/Mesen1/9280/ME000060S08720